MIFAAAHAASIPLASLMQDSGAIGDPTASRPFMFELNGVDRRDWWRVDTLEWNDTLGQPLTCSFTLINPSAPPVNGDIVRVLYFSEVLFAGMITNIGREYSTGLDELKHRCTCTDWSYILIRHRIRRNFTNASLAEIVDSIIDNELAGEGLSLGSIDIGSANIPLVDARNARIFDVFRDLAGVTGQAMYVDADKRIHFRATTNPAAPKQFTTLTIEQSSLDDNLEAYRNVQTVIVTGTPPEGQDAKRVEVQRINSEQIAARQDIEGGSGRYEDIEEVTHPTSNDAVDLTLMGIGYANLRLATSGTPRRTLRGVVRGYGFRAGQFVTVLLPHAAATGQWLIQRAQFREQAAQYLLYDIELTQSSTQLRAYESWLSIVKAGKVTIQMPSAITNNLEIFDTPGSTTWTVPAGVTRVEFTCKGGSGGGGGNWRYSVFVGRSLVCSGIAYGGYGGNSGKAVTTIDVTPGQEFTLVIGAAGTAGNNGSSSAQCGSATPSHGTDGTLSKVSFGSSIICQGNAGLGGTHATGNDLNGFPGSNGTDGSGIGDAVSVGGGIVGGTPNGPGADGMIEIRY